MTSDGGCELCEAARITPWLHDDDECWIAECEACDVPMVVWRTHRADPPDDVRARLLERLRSVVTAHYDGPFWIDDRPRAIPDHFHAHARPRRPWDEPLRRR